MSSVHLPPEGRVEAEWRKDAAAEKQVETEGVYGRHLTEGLTEETPRPCFGCFNKNFRF